MQDHPIRRMPGWGLRIHPNTDDPTLPLMTSLQAWQKMVVNFGHTINDLRGCIYNGIDSVWVEEGMKRDWRRQFGTHIDAVLSVQMDRSID